MVETFKISKNQMKHNLKLSFTNVFINTLILCFKCIRILLQISIKNDVFCSNAGYWNGDLHFYVLNVLYRNVLKDNPD